MVGLTEQFPGFPEQATPFGVTLSDSTDGSDVAQGLLQRQQAAEIPDSDDVDSVHDFYRETLPQAGWVLAEPRGSQLLFSGHGADGTVTISQDGSRVLISVAVYIPRPDPEQEPRVLVPVPDWFDDALPRLPDGAERVQVELSEGYESPRDGRQQPTRLRVRHLLRGEPADDDVATAAAHMREVTPAAGWTFLEEEDRSEERETSDGQVHTTDHLVLHYQGYEAYLAVHVFRSGVAGLALDAATVTLVYTAERED